MQGDSCHASLLNLSKASLWDTPPKSTETPISCSCHSKASMKPPRTPESQDLARKEKIHTSEPAFIKGNPPHTRVWVSSWSWAS